jgi:hypothetical protein
MKNTCMPVTHDSSLGLFLEQSKVFQVRGFTIHLEAWKVFVRTTWKVVATLVTTHIYLHLPNYAKFRPLGNKSTQ